MPEEVRRLFAFRGPTSNSGTEHRRAGADSMLAIPVSDVVAYARNARNGVLGEAATVDHLMEVGTKAKENGRAYVELTVRRVRQCIDQLWRIVKRYAGAAMKT
jgi:hypothetical protein